jgi:hypothetical protein
MKALPVEHWFLTLSILYKLFNWKWNICQMCACVYFLWSYLI